MFSAFAKFGFKEESFYPVYGLGEATLLVTYSPRETKTVPTCLTVSRSEMTENKRVEMKTISDDDALEIVGLGAPQSDTQLLIVNPKTKLPARDGEVGEIWVKNKSVAKGYWNKKALTNEIFRNFTADNQGTIVTQPLVAVTYHLFRSIHAHGRSRLHSKRRAVLRVQGQGLGDHQRRQSLATRHRKHC